MPISASPTKRCLILVAVFSVSWLSQAAAQEPGTITLDRMDATTRVGVQVGFDKIDDVSLSDGFVMRFEPYGQYVFPGKTVGLYGQWPISHSFASNGSDETGTGNFELGAFFLPNHSSDLILRAGLAFDTASTSNHEQITNMLATFERMTDLLLIAPNYTTFRVSASTLQQSGLAFFRGDLGLDLAIDKPSAGRGVYLRANLAVGVRLPTVDLAVELVNIGVLDGDSPSGISNRFFHTLALGFHTRGTDQFRAGMVFPLDESARGEIWIFSLGYQHAVD